jgi:hypothetical protein
MVSAGPLTGVFGGVAASCAKAAGNTTASSRNRAFGINRNVGINGLPTIIAAAQGLFNHDLVSF